MGRYYNKNRGRIVKNKANRPQNEDQEQRELINQIKKEFPNALIMCDIAGSYLLPSQRERAYEGRSGKGMPDIYIYSGRFDYAGLAIEFKKTGEKVLRKDGKLLKKKHLEEQNKMLLRFQSEKWLTGFCIGKFNAYETISNYLNSYHKFPYLIKPILPPTLLKGLDFGPVDDPQA